MQKLASTLCLLLSFGFGQAFAQSSLGTLTGDPKDGPTDVTSTAATTAVISAGKAPPNTYDTCDECLAALEARKGYYKPSYFGNLKKPPKRPIAKVVPLESDACVFMLVAGGAHRWAPRPAGTKIGFHADGEPVRDEECGNDTDDICYPKAKPVPAPPPAPPPPPPSPKPTPCPDCPPAPPCDPCKMKEFEDKTWQTAGMYWPKNTKSPKVSLDQLFDGHHGFWQISDKAVINDLQDRALRHLKSQKDLEWNEKRRRFDRKVQAAILLYNVCTKYSRLSVYWEGWHWKEYFLGLLTGIPIGGVGGWFLHEGPAVKGGFFNPGTPPN